MFFRENGWVETPRVTKVGILGSYIGCIILWKFLEIFLKKGHGMWSGKLVMGIFLEKFLGSRWSCIYVLI